MKKNKVGRPKLADSKLKKKSYIMLGISALLIMILLSGTLVSLNILPKFGKVKGEIVCGINDIPADLKPGGLHEYGFDDPKFYSIVVSNISNNASCEVTTDQLANISRLRARNKKIESANGIQYLTGLISLELNNSSEYEYDTFNNISSIDLSYNTSLKSIYLDKVNLTSIDLSNLTSLEALDLNDNNISGELDLRYIYFNSGSEPIDLRNNKLTSVKFGPNGYMDHVYLNNNNLTYLEFDTLQTGEIDVSNNNLSNIVGLEKVEFKRFYGYNNNLKSIDLPSFIKNCNNYPWGYECDENNISIGGNPMTNTKYLTKGIEIEYNPVLLNEDFPITTEISNDSVINLSDNKLSAIKEGISTIKMSNENIKSYDIDVMNKLDYCDRLYDEEGEERALQECSDYEELYNNRYSDYFFSQEIKVYDISSDKYSIDKDKKEISYSGEFNEDNITLTLDGLTEEVDGDKYIVKDGDVVADTFTLVNVKDNSKAETKTEDKKVTTTTKKEETATTKKSDKKINTTKKEETKVEDTTTKQSINKVVTTTMKEDKKNSVPIVPIAIGGTAIIAGIGYGIYVLKIK